MFCYRCVCRSHNQSANSAYFGPVMPLRQLPWRRKFFENVALAILLRHLFHSKTVAALFPPSSFRASHTSTFPFHLTSTMREGMW